MDFFSIMAFLTEYPVLALTPAVAFAFVFFASKERMALVTAASWVAYAIYEYGMTVRLLCTGECNIRVDLLLIYPVLVGLSLMTIGMIAARQGG